MIDPEVLAELGQAGAEHGLARIRLARSQGPLARAAAADALAAATGALDQAQAAALDPANRAKPVLLPDFLAARSTRSPRWS